MGMYIALTGGIAAGKSTVARHLSEHGAIVIDADRLARSAVEPGTAALAAIQDRFGAQVIARGGQLDRAALATIVFGDEQALAVLNGIVHPSIRELVDAAKSEAFVADPGAVVVYDIPLMTPADASGYDLVMVVDAPAAQRASRLVAERGMLAADAGRRIASQPPTDEILAVADIVIDSSADVANTLRQVDRAWERMRVIP